MENELEDKNERLVIGYFETTEQAEAAEEAVKKWDEQNQAVKLGSVGILVNENGKIKTHTSRRTGKGAAVGVGLGLLAGVLTGGIGLIGGMLAGGLVGGATGSLFKKSLGLSPEDMKEISDQLEAGHAAVVVMCDDYEVDGVLADLRQKGGTASVFNMSSAALPEAAKAVDEATVAASAAVETATDTAGQAADAASAAVDTAADAVSQATDAAASAGATA